MPSFDWPVIGHQAIINYLQTSLNNHSLHQAYLFYGPDGLGKSLVAEYFIKSIYCQSSANRPCGACRHCRQITNQAHPDIIYLQVAEDKKNITVEQIRELKEKIQHSSFLNSYKTVLISQAHKLSLAASNALLKVLEEPGPQTIFILIAPSIKHIPATILSRSQLIKFSPVGAETIKKALINQGVERILAHELSYLAAGLPGKIMPFVAHSQKLINFKNETRQLLANLSAGLNQRFLLVSELTAQSQSVSAKFKIQAFLNNFILLMRDVLLVKIDNDKNLVHLYLKDKLKYLAERYSSQQITQFIHFAQEADELMEQNINQRLLLENLMLALEK